MTEETEMQEEHPAQEEMNAEPEGEQVEHEEEATASDDSGDDSAADPPRKSGVQKRIDELTRQRYEAQRQAEYYRQLAEQKQPPKEPEKPREAPKPEDFDDDYKYFEALADHRADERLREYQKQTQANQTQAQQQQAQAEMAANYRVRAAKFAEEHPDYDVVANNPYLPVSTAMAEAIQVSERGPEVLYHLGQNPEEAGRIAQLSPVAAAREIGALEAKLSLPKAKKTTSAPAPVGGIKKGSGKATKGPSEMSPEEYQQWRFERRNR